MVCTVIFITYQVNLVFNIKLSLINKIFSFRNQLINNMCWTKKPLLSAKLLYPLQAISNISKEISQSILGYTHNLKMKYKVNRSRERDKQETTSSVFE